MKMKENQTCKHYKKEKGKNGCKNFLGYRVLKVEDLVSGKGEHEIEIIESCSCRCRVLKKV